MDDDHGSMMMGPPSPSPSASNATMMPRHHPMMMMMHMTFYWGKNAEILFTGWPGTSTGMYVLSLIIVFLLAGFIEWLSRSRLVKPGTNDVVSGVILTFLHALRMGLAYIVMLAVMSFNGGIFIVAVAGHAIGFLLFGTRIFGSGRRELEDDKRSDLPPLSC